MLDSPIIGLAIGLFFLFAILASLASAVTEAIAQFLGLRGAFLLRGLRSLVDGSDVGDATELKKLFDKPILKNLGKSGPITSQQLDGAKSIFSLHDLQAKRSMPSYISARTFASGVIDFVIPDATGQTDMAKIAAEITKMPGEGVFKEQLLSIAKASTGDIEKFRTSIETWYDDHMDRVSGWYKRYTRWITAVVGAVIVIGLNVQIFAFAESLYTDQALSQAVVSKAVAASNCDNKDPGTCIAQAREQIQGLEPGLSLGWGQVADCQVAHAQCSFWQAHGFTDPAAGSSRARDLRVALTLILGWVLTIFALIPGSRFWFDLINQFGSLRGAGPKPTTSTAKS